MRRVTSGIFCTLTRSNNGRSTNAVEIEQAIADMDDMSRVVDSFETRAKRVSNKTVTHVNAYY